AKSVSIEVPVEAVEAAPAAKEKSELPEPRELPKRGGGGGCVFLLVILVAGGVAGYVFRDKIMAWVNPPSVAPTPSASASASASAEPSASAAPPASASASAEP